MKIYFARHGTAESQAATDPDLAPSGRDEVLRVAAFLGEQNLEIETIFHSGKKRAEETARLLGEHIAPRCPVEGKVGLKPNDPVLPLIQEVETLENPVLFVGHLPFIDRFLSCLLLGEETLGFIDFAAGSVSCLQRESGAWQLAWHVTPKLFG